MDHLTLNVSQLRCACVDKVWLASYLAGQNPSPFTPNNAGGVIVHGQAFHSLVEKFISWATDQKNREKAEALVDDEEIVSRLRLLGADELTDKWLLNNEIDEVAVFTEALYNFAERVQQLRRFENRLRAWNDLYLGQEISIDDVMVYTGEGAIFVSGKIDSLRIHPSHDLEITDYKLTQGHELEKELVQLSIYQKLLQVKKPGFTYRGCIEYFIPVLQIQEVSSHDLESIYREKVEPVLPLLLGRLKSSSGTTSGSGQNGHTPSKTKVEEMSGGAIRLGKERSPSGQDLSISALSLTCHTAILGGSGSGKTNLALCMVEQALKLGVSVLLVDRKGDLCRYADPDAWSGGISDPEILQRREDIKGKFDVSLYTLGHSSGRPLGIRIVPQPDEDPTEMDMACKSAGIALAEILDLNSRATDAPKVAILTSVIRILCEEGSDRDITLDDFIMALDEPSEQLTQIIRPLEKHRTKVIERLQTTKIMRGDLLAPQREKLDASLFFPKSGKPRLTILATKFLRDKPNTQFWITQLLLELGRFASRHPSPILQGLAMFDEADLYLPATSKPPTKEPMENLLRRARSAGLGIMLATQSPGDFDYKCKENVLNWMVGLVKEKTSLEKLRPLFSDDQLDELAEISRQKTGQFMLLKEGRVKPFAAPRSIIPTMQVADADILKLSKTL